MSGSGFSGNRLACPARQDLPGPAHLRPQRGWRRRQARVERTMLGRPSPATSDRGTNACRRVVVGDAGNRRSACVRRRARVRSRVLRPPVSSEKSGVILIVLVGSDGPRDAAHRTPQPAESPRGPADFGRDTFRVARSRQRQTSARAAGSTLPHRTSTIVVKRRWETTGRSPSRAPGDRWLASRGLHAPLVPPRSVIDRAESGCATPNQKTVLARGRMVGGGIAVGWARPRLSLGLTPDRFQSLSQGCGKG